MLFCINAIGTAFVCVGFWVILAGVGSPRGHYEFNILHFAGHFVTLFPIIAEYMLIPKVHLQNSALYLILFLLSFYTTFIYVLLRNGIIEGAPYAPYSTSTVFKAGTAWAVAIIFYCVKMIV